MNWKDLQAPFARNEVKTKTVSGRTESYITARQVMNRLDTVCGPDGWYDVYQQIDAKHIECTLFIKCGEQFIGKTDVGEASNFAPMKGAYSDAFKRAAVRWGIGRELYQEGTVDWDDDAPAERPQAGKTSPKSSAKPAPRANTPTQPQPDADGYDRDMMAQTKVNQATVAEFMRYVVKVFEQVGGNQAHAANAIMLGLVATGQFVDKPNWGDVYANADGLTIADLYDAILTYYQDGGTNEDA